MESLSWMMTYIRLQPAEWQRLRSIRLRALEDAPDAFGSTLDEASRWGSEVWSTQAAHLPTIVAVKDGCDVGIARYAPDEAQPQTGWLISMWVDPGARRAGVGSALVDAIAELARAEGVTRLLLDVADRNGPAIALYEAKGFTPNGETGSLPEPRTGVREHQRERWL
jgi:GNAT superfamily N-acetyltransferase